MNITGETSEWLEFAQALADAAREIVLPAARVDPRVEVKADETLVTATDHAVEMRLREMIAARYPTHGILGEEFGATAIDSHNVWVLDPIDGTAPFIAGIPVYGTLIALARDGKPYIGVIDHPATNERWLGVVGEGAYFNAKQVHTRPCACLGTAFMTNSSPDFFNAVEFQQFSHLKAHVRYTQYGGSCYAYGSLASGRTDLAVDAGMEAFDLMAPAAVVLAAGGMVTDWSGSPLTIDNCRRILAAGDASLHSLAIERLR